ncbi:MULTISPECIES: hypothetical protein [Alcanivorax]|uniref:hypothetical protein n=1 Tax=Alcanivorax TaxID=59753 RepID=UPI0025C1843C|nr:hypothetical protein [Alcanivorax sp.]
MAAVVAFAINVVGEWGVCACIVEGAMLDVSQSAVVDRMISFLTDYDHSIQQHEKRKHHCRYSAFWSMAMTGHGALYPMLAFEQG